MIAGMIRPNMTIPFSAQSGYSKRSIPNRDITVMPMISREKSVRKRFLEE